MSRKLYSEILKSGEPSGRFTGYDVKFGRADRFGHSYSTDGRFRIDRASYDHPDTGRPAYDLYDDHTDDRIGYGLSSKRVAALLAGYVVRYEITPGHGDLPAYGESPEYGSTDYPEFDFD